MTVEILSYTLSLGAKAVGSQIIKTAVTPRVTTLECHALFQGVFGPQSLSQTSQLATPTGESLRFSEETDTKGDKRTYEVVFDARSGLVKATRQTVAGSETAETPYFRPYSDPLGLLHRLRAAPTGAEGRRQVAMLGKDVVIESLGRWTLETPQGERATFGYLLHPGLAYVYLDAHAPYAPLRVSQPTLHGQLEAFLVRTAQEDGSLGTPVASPQDRANKRRRRGGRKRRRVESKS